nr:MAG TPA: tail protein [Caudoviricetes sp.]
MNKYTTVQGDMWDAIAYKIFGNELYMNELLEANNDYRNVAVFPAGIVLTVPKINTIQSSKILPPWKR